MFGKLSDLLTMGNSIRSQVALKEWWPTLKSKLTGHYNYFGISGNFQSISKFYCRTVQMVHKWINRRGSKKVSYNWLENYLQWNPLPMPKIMFSLYANITTAKQNSYIEEPYVGKPPVGFCEGYHSNETSFNKKRK